VDKGQREMSVGKDRKARVLFGQTFAVAATAERR